MSNEQTSLFDLPNSWLHSILSCLRLDSLRHLRPLLGSFSLEHLYNIVFVDDYSQVSWVYLIKESRQVRDIVCQFIQEIITPHSTTPKVIQTDNALELIQMALQQFCVEKEIIHQTTCTYTSSQNGVAERKHCIFLHITLTLLYEMDVLHHLWSDVVMTTTYPYNWLPSSLLGGTIPLTRLFPNVSLFPLQPRVFGWIAFVQVYTPSLSKLAPWWCWSCVFLVIVVR